MAFLIGLGDSEKISFYCGDSVVDGSAKYRTSPKARYLSECDLKDIALDAIRLLRDTLVPSVSADEIVDLMYKCPDSTDAYTYCTVINSIKTSPVCVVHSERVAQGGHTRYTWVTKGDKSHVKILHLSMQAMNALERAKRMALQDKDDKSSARLRGRVDIDADPRRVPTISTLVIAILGLLIASVFLEALV